MKQEKLNRPRPELDLDLDFAELDVKDVELFLQEGSKGLPDYAASSSSSAEAAVGISVTCSVHSCSK